MAFQVNNKMCTTCIFGANSPISVNRFNELKTQWEKQDIVQECHAATTENLHIGCRGHYEAARCGAIVHPITTIAANMGLVGIKMDTLMQIYERMGLIVFVDIPKDSTNDV